MSQPFSITFREIESLLDGQLDSETNGEIYHIAAIDEANVGDITFLSNPKYESKIYDCKASLIIVHQGFKPKRKLNSALLLVEDPYVAFSTLHEYIQKSQALEKLGREIPIYIGEGSQIGEQEYIGAFSYIGKGVTIGKQVKIHPQVHIGDGCHIGDFSVLYPGVKLYDHTIIGRHCTIQSGAVIGSHGFGFAPSTDGSFQSIPQSGNVIIGDHVDIGANTTIDCATLGSTIVEDGVKIDNLVQIAHNVQIGKNTVIAAQTGVSGSTTIGKNVMIGGQVGTVGHIHIADHTKIGARSGVTKNTKSDQILFGVPAIDRNQYLRSYAIYKKLPEVINRIQELEQKLLTLNPNKKQE